ncbi:hypothetical protein [Microcystis phage Mwe-JY26]
MCHFSLDARHIARASRESVDVFFWVAVFVILTIRQPFYLMPAQMADVKANGAASRFLFGWKRQAFRALAERKAELQAAAIATHEGRMSLDSLILLYLSIPGLGIVKASFLAQMTAADGACLDTHNLRALGLDESAFKTPKTLKVETIAQRIIAYNAVWRAIGDSAHWWNGWCDFVATLYPDRYKDGAAVSRLHRLPLEVAGWE